jgi:hypothetical protein
VLATVSTRAADPGRPERTRRRAIVLSPASGARSLAA